MTEETDLAVYLSPAEYVDSDHPDVIAFAERAWTGASTGERLRNAYLAVRDGIRYNPYVDLGRDDAFRASGVLRDGQAYCVGKASLYTAVCRIGGVPARVGFADVRNHLATPKLLERMGTNLFSWHGYVECFVGGRWVKASPTFDAPLCARLNVEPLDFDGVHDALMHAFDSNNTRFMEYVAVHGAFFDVPVKFLRAEMRRAYPTMWGTEGARGVSMHDEAAQQAQG